MIVSSALMIWKGLMVVTGSESPIVVVLSGSMEPAFHRGDLLFLTNYPEEPVRVGEIVVFKVEGRDIPIVHRVIKLHEKWVAPTALPRTSIKISMFLDPMVPWSSWRRAITIQSTTGAFTHPDSCGSRKKTSSVELAAFYLTSAWSQFWWTNTRISSTRFLASWPSTCYSTESKAASTSSSHFPPWAFLSKDWTKPTSCTNIFFPEAQLKS